MAASRPPSDVAASPESDPDATLPSSQVGSDDRRLQMLLVKLELLGPDDIGKAARVQQEETVKGQTIPFAAAIVKAGLLPYGIVERLLSHMENRPIKCTGCGQAAEAGKLDPRTPFKCPNCNEAIAPSQAPSDLSILDTMITDDAAALGEEDLSGQILGGCTLLRKIGEGGMGAVYEAEQTFLKRKVAVKILPEHHVRRQGFVERFLRESRTAAQIVHPNVVQVHDAGKEGNTYYIIMEYVEGLSLYDMLRKEGSLPVPRVLEFCKQSAMGLGAAAKVGVIHRDIKPDNIRITPDGTAKVADFGLAKGLEMGDQLTVTGAVLGTPLYMSPEQAKGETVDFRTDIYSLGATMYHLVSGGPPFHGGSAIAILQKHAMEEPPLLATTHSGIPGVVEELILRMMAKSPDDRFSTYSELIEAFEEAEAVVSGRKPAVKGPRPKPRPLGAPADDGKKKMMIGGGVALLAIVALLVVAFAMGWIGGPGPGDGGSGGGANGGAPLAALGAMMIDSSPQNARVFVDGTEMGSTPWRRTKIPVGTKSLRIELDGYQPYEETIDLADGAAIERRVDLVPRGSMLSVKTDPPGGTVFIDGEEAGTTPLDPRELAAGEHTIRIELEGHAPIEETVTLEAGRGMGLEKTLAPLGGSLAVRSEPVEGATVRVDGSPVGKTPLDLADVAPGEHAIRVELEGYAPVDRKVTVVPGGGETIAVTLEVLLASASVTSTPEGALIRVNGEDRGRTPLELAGLPPGEYAFEASLPLHLPRQWVKTLEAGERYVDEIELFRPQRVRDFLKGLGGVSDLLEKGLPLRAGDAFDGLLGEGGFPEGMSDDETASARALQAAIAKRSPTVSLSIRFPDGARTKLVGAPALKPDTAAAPPESDDATYEVRLGAASGSGLRGSLLQFLLVGKEGFRLLPDEGRMGAAGARLPALPGDWAKTYALGDTEVLLFLLVVTSEEIAVDDVDTLKRDLVKGSRDYPGAWGPKLVQEVRTWLADKVNDFSVRAIWIDERAARKG